MKEKDHKLEIFIPQSMNWEDAYQDLKHLIHSHIFKSAILTNPLQEKKYHSNLITDKTYTWVFFY